jgi:nucleotide-binding universal stress UspA family protein
VNSQEPQRAAVGVPRLGRHRGAPSGTTGADRPTHGNADHTTKLVIAGIDGSGCARDAARWAAAEAISMHAGLGLVFAYHLPPAGSSGYSPYPANLLADLRENGQGVLADTAALLHRDNPGLKITTKLAYGRPADVLRKASRQAVLTVVGAHGANRVAVALGSVAADVAESCPGPVAVIHSAQTHSSGPVVVGVDGSAASRAAIGYAFAAADARKAPVIAVHCWSDPSIDGPVPAYSAGVLTVQQIQDEERSLLIRELADWVDRYPDVRAQKAVIHDRPAVGLLEYAQFAQFIVAGSRGHGGIAGMLLGSTGQALIAHSSCPVVIVRPVPNTAQRQGPKSHRVRAARPWRPGKAIATISYSANQHKGQK